MKKQFSNAWRASRQARKQRKYLANALKHLVAKMISGHLSKDLREKYNRRAFQLKKGDTVKIMSGENKGKIGKITEIISSRKMVSVEGLQMTKKDGSKANLHFHPSRLMITELNLEDKRRLDSIQKAKSEKKEK